MPRIAAANIEEHVRLQNERITKAARKLFVRNGFHATDLGDIAQEVGLARNSLYRYFDNKDALLLECVREDMAPHLERFASLVPSYPDPAERIIALVNFQFDLATGPAHATLELMQEVREGSRSLRKQIEQLHAAPNTIVAAALDKLQLPAAAAATTAALIGGMVMAATAHALTLKRNERDSVRYQLLAAVQVVLEAECYEVS